jgi:hypothetical protein
MGVALERWRIKWSGETGGENEYGSLVFLCCGRMTRKEAPAGAKSALVIAAFCNLRDTYLLQGGLPPRSINFLPPLCVYVFVCSDYGFYRSLGID